MLRWLHIEQMARINRACLSVCVVADVAAEHRRAALQSVVALLPDENREALHCLLLFLNRLADFAAENQVFGVAFHSLVIRIHSYGPYVLLCLYPSVNFSQVTKLSVPASSGKQASHRNVEWSVKSHQFLQLHNFLLIKN